MTVWVKGAFLRAWPLPIRPALALGARMCTTTLDEVPISGEVSLQSLVRRRVWWSRLETTCMKLTENSLPCTREGPFLATGRSLRVSTLLSCGTHTQRQTSVSASGSSWPREPWPGAIDPPSRLQTPPRTTDLPLRTTEPPS